MQPYPIQVDMDQGEKLDPMSRIDYAKPQTIHHYVKVKSVGKVNRKSMNSLIYQFRLVFDEGSLAGRIGDARPSSALLTSPTTQTKYETAIDALIALGYTRERAVRQLNRNTNRAGAEASSSRRGDRNGDNSSGDDNSSELEHSDHESDDEQHEDKRKRRT